MSDVRVIEVKQSIFANNNKRADKLRAELKKDKTYFLNLMSSPGSGKTTTLLKTIDFLKGKLKIGIMEADIDGDVDAQVIKDSGIKSIQLHTGGMCHLDSEMTRQGLDELGTKDIDLAILENVGNLVCPAEFDTGSHLNVVILSICEGDDKPLKYPLMFEMSDVLLINKIDVEPYFDFDMKKVTDFALMRNNNIKIFPISAKTGQGIDKWCDFLLYKVNEFLN